MTCEGEGAGTLPLDASNLVVRGARLAFIEAGYTSLGPGWEGLPPVSFRLVNRIPIAAGLGSSSAAIVAGLLAGLTLTGTTMNVENEERMLQLAATIEGHVDNLAPAIYGGMQIGIHTGTAPGAPGRWYTTQVPVPPGLQCILFIPDQRQSTEGARAVLSPSLTREQAVFNIGRAAMLVNAFASGQLLDLALGTEDCLHQPPRAAIMPALAPVIAGARRAGALGAFLSGAGSAIMALTSGRKGDPHGQAAKERRDVEVARGMVEGARSVGMAGKLLITHPCVGIGASVVELDGDEGAVVTGKGLMTLEDFIISSSGGGGGGGGSGGGEAGGSGGSGGSGGGIGGSLPSASSAPAPPTAALQEDAAWVALARASASTAAAAAAAAAAVEPP